MEDSKKTAPKKANPQTTKMERGGITADVHKDEVANYIKSGWVAK